MKIIVKRKEWHRLIGGDFREEETTYEFENVNTNCEWIDWGAAYEPEGKKIKGALPREKNFSFKVNEINKDNVVLEIGGDAGLSLKELDEDKNKTKLNVLHIDEERNFQTHTRDFGISYTITLVNANAEKVEKLKFRKFNQLFLVSPILNKEQISMFAPIIYSMEDRYYKATVNFLQTGEMTNLYFKEFGLFNIMEGYWHSKNDKNHYLEALIILNNIEKANENDRWIIYNPYIIE